MATRTVRLDDEAEAALRQIREATGSAEGIATMRWTSCPLDNRRSRQAR
jgi:hypothetical protein